jgi:uncharacterized protein (DUF1499 family)
MSVFDVVEQRKSQNWGILEKVGESLLAPGRLFFGKKFVLAKDHEGKFLLKNFESRPSLLRLIAKVTAIVLIPFSALFVVLGMGIKYLSHQLNHTLRYKYHHPRFINARRKENFLGKLPESPWSPNCVNSQKKSLWGKSYNVDPIAIPVEIANPLATLKNLLANTNKPNFKSSLVKLVEGRENYLHYTYTVVIPSGPVKGTYIDDVDIYYNATKHLFELRSASRSGFRDALHFSFSKPGANKKRVEAIREVFREYLSKEVLYRS